MSTALCQDLGVAEQERGTKKQAFGGGVVGCSDSREADRVGFNGISLA